MTSSSVGWNLNPGGRNKPPPCSDLTLRSTMIDLLLELQTLWTAASVRTGDKPGSQRKTKQREKLSLLEEACEHKKGRGINRKEIERGGKAKFYSGVRGETSSSSGRAKPPLA